MAKQTINELRAALRNDVISLERAQADLQTLLSGGTVPNLCIPGAHGNIVGLRAVIAKKRALLVERIVTEGETIELGNNETKSVGVFANTDGTFTALTLAQSKTFKTRKGAERWLSGKLSAY